jgi:hypothetical protein
VPNPRPSSGGKSLRRDFYRALTRHREAGTAKRQADRRRVHYGVLHVRTATAATADSSAEVVSELGPASGEDADDGPGRIVREKEHPAKPMTVDQALFEMELVGHDFYLFADQETGRPSVVYRRRAYDYGLIRLTD